MEDRIQKAVELFKSGYNCSQSVVAAFADMYGFTQEQAVRMSASFGGGIGRMRETCGAACGLFLIAGLETGATEATDREGKAANYAVVPAAATPKVSGVSTSKDWEIVEIDPKAVPLAVAGIELRPVDQAAVMRLIRASKGQIEIPGITYRQVAKMSFRG